jgi:endonuclease YncB( thermonuclease family)
MWWKFAFVAVLVLAQVQAQVQAAPAAAPTLTGQATATDGDTLRMGPVRVRLYGIDAPEIDQTCEAGGLEYACGEASRDALMAIVGAGTVECRIGAVDRYGRLLATCWANGKDVGREMVRQGWALAYREYSERYVADEDEARRGRHGLWAGEFVPPWEWRRR